jgi:hypothetical protein
MNRRLPFSGLKKQEAASTAQLASVVIVSCLASSSILKMEATCSFEMSVDFQRSTRRYILQPWESQMLHNLQVSGNIMSGKIFSPETAERTITRLSVPVIHPALLG